MEPRIREVGSLLFINLTLLKYITVLKYISLCINSSVFKLNIGFTVVCFVWINVLVVASNAVIEVITFSSFSVFNSIFVLM